MTFTLLVSLLGSAGPAIAAEPPPREAPAKPRPTGKKGKKPKLPKKKKGLK
ncbi:MAG: hypothetical protein ABMB14_27905 [Myxococcota bacterium]